MMVVFSLSVLSGFGVRRLIGEVRHRKYLQRGVICGLIPLVLIAEYSCFPLSFYYVPQEVPAVYDWLRLEESEVVVLEIPIASSERTLYKEAKYMYWSTFHWKRLVNGYSGFSPPSYWEINKVMQNFPDIPSIEMLKDLKVDYIIVHSKEIPEETWQDMQNRVVLHSDRLRLKIRLGSDYVYEVQ